MKYIYILLLLTLFLSNCKEVLPEEFDSYASNPNSEKSKNPANRFIWEALNSYYVWQDKVPKLKVNSFKNRTEYVSFLDGFENPKDLFNELLYKRGEYDRFSVIVEDYDKHAEQLKGVYLSFGFWSENIFASNGVNIIAVTNVLVNSPAEEANLKRGDFIIGINGRKFCDGDFSKIFKEEFYNPSVKFMVGKLDGKTLIREISLDRTKVDTKAIQYSNIYKVGNKSVGYLVYNGFWEKNNNDLNQVFTKFKNSPNNITDFILDLRYNGGGSIRNSAYLGSLIYGEGTTDKIFTTLIFNKIQNNSYSYNFVDEMLNVDKSKAQLNRLKGVNTLYVLTSHNTASASEIIINCLKPYMNVKVIGQTTKGKNVGSFTLFDSPKHGYRNKEFASKEHKYALQPVIFTIYNSNIESNYYGGLSPDIEIDEFKNINGLKPFGDKNESLLKAALNDISGLSPRSTLSNQVLEVISHEVSEENPAGDRAYISDDEDIKYFEGL